MDKILLISVYLIHIDLPDWAYFWTSADLKKDKKPSEGWTWLSTNKTFKYPAFDGLRAVNLKVEPTTKNKKDTIEGKCLLFMVNSKLDKHKHEIIIRPMKCNNPYFFYCYKSKK